MASTPFKVVSWSPNDPITNEKLSAMVDNDNWLKDNAVRARYSGSGVTKDTGVRLASGFALISPSKARTFTRTVGFGNYFSNGCIPIITTGTVSAAQRQVWITIDGPGSSLFPTRDGFQVTAFIDTLTKKKNITRSMWVAWHALGW